MRTDILQQAHTIRASMDSVAIMLTDEQAAKISQPLSHMGSRSGGRVR